MNDRMKYLRKEVLDFTQEQFASRIGLVRSTVAGIEKGKINLTDRNIKSICKEFNVNEVWLRTGEGGNDNMFNQLSEEDEYSLSLGKLTMEENEFVRNTIKYLANTEPEKLKVIEEFMMSCLGIDKKEKE